MHDRKADARGAENQDGRNTAGAETYPGLAVRLLSPVGAVALVPVADVDEGRLVAIEALINSMTAHERRRPGLLNASRKKRVARGSGRSVQELNQLLRQYKQMRKIMKMMNWNWMQSVRGG